MVVLDVIGHMCPDNQSCEREQRREYLPDIEQHTLLSLGSRSEGVADHLHKQQWQEQAKADLHREVVLVGHADSTDWVGLSNLGSGCFSIGTTPVIHKP